ncbi:MAG: histone deacetylase [Bacteroidia bacterium]
MLKIAFHTCFEHHLPEGHRFPMIKYHLIPQQLLYEGVITHANLFEPEMLDEQTLLQTHHKDYWQQLKELTLDEKHQRRIGFPLNKALVERELRIVQGSIDCALFAMQYGVALNVAGGTHHAFTNRGEGFCLLNDFAVAANFLLYKKLAKRILIVDLDVHQGNGTASIFYGSKSVFTFSMHGKYNYPFFKEKSNLDVELPDGISDYEYLQLLKENLYKIINSFKPDFIFYQSGVDVLQTDKYGKLNITENGCKNRDEIVFETCKNYQIPVAVAMGGGYSPKIADIVNAHCNTFKAAAQIIL